MTRCWAKNVAFSTLKGCANSRTDGCSRKQKKVFWNKQVAFFLKRCNGKFRSRFRIWSESFPDVDIRWNRTFSRLNVPVSVTTFALMSIFPIARLSTRALMLSFNFAFCAIFWWTAAAALKLDLQNMFQIKLLQCLLIFITALNLWKLVSYFAF